MCKINRKGMWLILHRILTSNHYKWNNHFIGEANLDFSTLWLQLWGREEPHARYGETTGNGPRKIKKKIEILSAFHFIIVKTVFCTLDNRSAYFVTDEFLTVSLIVSVLHVPDSWPKSFSCLGCWLRGQPRMLQIQYAAEWTKGRPF